MTRTEQAGWSTPAFRPAAWLPGAHLQTIVPALLRASPLAGERVRLELADGDFLDLDVFLPIGEPRAFSVLVHGLEGSSRSPYIHGTAQELLARGFAAVALNQRGCSGEPNRLPRSYHSGVTEDLLAVLDWAIARFPGVPGSVVGFSLGGNQTLKALGERGDDLPEALRAAVAVSPPFDLEEVADCLDSRWGALYRYNFLRTLVPKALEKARRHPGYPSRRRILRGATSLRAYDDAVTAPVHGFDGASDYYRRSICTRHLGGIARRTLIITSRDDPIIPGHTIPERETRDHPHIEVLVTGKGGHVGFVTGSIRRPRYFAEVEAARWLAVECR